MGLCGGGGPERLAGGVVLVMEMGSWFGWESCWVWSGGGKNTLEKWPFFKKLTVQQPKRNGRRQNLIEGWLRNLAFQLNKQGPGRPRLY